MTHAYRHTKIVVTLGPTTEAKAELATLIEAGVDVMRLNMAHASHAWVEEVIWHIREVSDQVGRDVAIMMDVKGPEIRTGKLDTPLNLQVGDLIEFHTAAAISVHDSLPSIPVNYAGLPGDVEVGCDMLVDSGLIKLRIVDKDDTHVLARVLTPGSLGSRRHINLPGVHVQLPALTEKDEHDLRAGVAAGIDFVALSFVREAADVFTLRRFLEALGSKAKIIAKIEDQAGVRNHQEIIQAADAVMVARGDLGIEIEYHKLPLVQRDLVRTCQLAGKPVIIATQLLESMISSPMPTRAEISDVSNAVREQADAVMLSGETATGAYPLESIQVLKNIIESIEPSVQVGLNRKLELHEPKSKMLRSAAVLAQELGNSGIVVFTRSGYLAYSLGAAAHVVCPSMPLQIFSAFSDSSPYLGEWNPSKLISPTIQKLRSVAPLNCLKAKGWCSSGTWLVVITNALASSKIIDTLQLRQID